MHLGRIIKLGMGNETHIILFFSIKKRNFTPKIYLKLNSSATINNAKWKDSCV